MGAHKRSVPCYGYAQTAVPDRTCPHLSRAMISDQIKDKVDDESLQSTIQESKSSTPIQKRKYQDFTVKSENEKSNDEIIQIYKQTESRTRIDYK